MTKYTIKPTTQFKKDLKIAEKSHRNISQKNSCKIRIYVVEQMSMEYFNALKGKSKYFEACRELSVGVRQWWRYAELASEQRAESIHSSRQCRQLTVISAGCDCTR